MNDLSMLPGLTRKTETAMREAGIYTLADVLVYSVTDLCKIKGIGPAKAREFHTCAQAFAHNRAITRATLPDLARRPGVMLDLETRLDTGVPWCFGYQIENEFRIAIVDAYYDGGDLLLPGGQSVIVIEDSDTGWRLVADAFRQYPGPVYHWGGFEMGVLKATAPQDVIDTLQGHLHDLNRTFKQTYAIPVRGTSIKKVAPWLGFGWPEGSDAMTAWADYNGWLLMSDRDALARACAYNRADVEALDLIWRWMNQQSG